MTTGGMPPQPGSVTPGGAPPSPPPTPSGPKKADLGKRLVAALIDALLALAVGFIPFIGGLIAAAYWLLRDGLEIEFMDHRSLGKKLLKLRPVREDGGPVDLMVSVKRNWMFAFGGLAQLLIYIPILGWLMLIPVGLIALAFAVVELVLVITHETGQRLGDRMAATKVIEVAD